MSGAPAPVRAISGGVFDSSPGQNGQPGAAARRPGSDGAPSFRPSSGAVSPGAVSPGEGNWPPAARPAATITSCPLNGSWRSSDIAIGYRSRCVRGLLVRAPTFVGMPSLRDHRWRPRRQHRATVAATLGAEVTLVERDIIGGAAHLWDCIPSKAMIATGGALVELDRAPTMGLAAEGHLDVDALRDRVRRSRSVCTGCATPLESQGVRWSGGPARSPTRTGRGRDHRRDRGDRRRRLRASPPARGRGSPTGRRSTGARPHHPRGVPAARDPRAHLRDRLGRHRRRVHAHVQRARQRGDARGVAPAGAPDEGRRGRRGARGRVPGAGRPPPQGRARHRRSTRPTTACTSRATTAVTSTRRT